MYSYKSEMRLLRENLINYIILSLPILTLVIWSFHNTQITISDGAAYIDYAVYVSSAWEQGNYIEFVERIFGYRGWRPNIFYYFYLPPLILTGQNLVISAFIVNLFFITLSLFFIYKIFKLYLTSIESSLCASIICCTYLVMCGGWEYPLFSEIAFIPFCIATLYYLFICQIFNNKKYSYMFAIFLFLTISTRPMQGMLNLIPPFMAYCLFYINNNNLDIKAVIKALLAVLIALSILFLVELAPSNFNAVNNNTLQSIGSNQAINLFNYLALATIVCTLILFLFYKFNNFIRLNDHTNKYLFKAFLLFSILLILFFGQHFSELYRWIYIAGFGSNVSNYERSLQILDIFYEAALKGGLFLITIISILYLITVLKNIFLNNRANFKNVNIYFVILSLPIPLIIYLFTAQKSFRVLALAIILLFIFALIYICKNYKNPYLKNIVLSIILSIIFLGNYSKYASQIENRSFTYKNDNKIIHYIVGNAPSPINISPNPNEKLVSEISKISRLYGAQSFGIQASGMEAINPAYSSLLTKVEKNNHFFLNTLTAPDASKKMNLDYIKEYDAIIITNPISLHKISHGFPVDEVISKTGVDPNSIGNLEKISINTNFYKNFINKKNINQFWINKLNNSSMYAIYLAYLYTNDELTNLKWKEAKCFQLFNKKSRYQEKACIILNTRRISYKN